MEKICYNITLPKIVKGIKLKHNNKEFVILNENYDINLMEQLDNDEQFAFEGFFVSLFYNQK